ncbi:hypothetical protein [Acaryochloris marina]|uniref:hypothetical protein n=1 Tax=Acaryochloris marina TaxID=155978 RepID=UPI0002FDFCDA|nr:hypothetical protein [Acaryochloris marina]BDM78805.1 hypothetical protein AM10699_16740 [Acaryochloris marina MBIC10699]
MLSPSLLHDLWQLIEELPTYSLLGWDDTRIVSWLLEQFEHRSCLKEEDRASLEQYLDSHLLLIREMAESNQYCALVV